VDEQFTSKRSGDWSGDRNRPRDDAIGSIIRICLQPSIATATRALPKQSEQPTFFSVVSHGQIDVADINVSASGPHRKPVGTQAMIELSPFQSQMMLVAGLVMLGWMLIRRQLRSRRRMHDLDLSTRDLRIQLAKVDKPTGVPLSSAPIETQRWQVEMMDLQRELKAELDTKIMVMQVLIRQADERIASLRHLAK